jgi:outer membrane protein assembly factor BamD
MEALNDGRHLDALKFFDHVRYKFPYSAQAAAADLAIADTNFDREKYLEAIDGYRNFLKLHPNNPKVDYAQYRIALSYYKDIPSDFFIFPPSTEKDQTSVKDARGASRSTSALPELENAEEAKKLLADVLGRLAEHEMGVADFYLDHSRYPAAVNRLTKLIADYPTSALAPRPWSSWPRPTSSSTTGTPPAPPSRSSSRLPDDELKSEAEELLKALA